RLDDFTLLPASGMCQGKELQSDAGWETGSGCI
ncbi:unnamed protein product, partial [Arabidopsis lyrata]